MSIVQYQSFLQAKTNMDIVSFFAGAGFLDLGFEKAGFTVSYVNEIHQPFVEAYQYARSKMGIPVPKFGFHTKSMELFLDGDEKKQLSNITQASRSQGRPIGFIGGPPCPDFSVGGKNRGKLGDNGRLSGSYINLVVQQKPDFFVFENVKGLWKTRKHRAFYDQLKNTLSNGGYVLTENLINAISFGAPQDRERIIVFGIRADILPSNKSIEDFNWQQHQQYQDRTAFEYNWPETTAFIEDTPLAPPTGIRQELTVQHWFDKNDVKNHPNASHHFTPRAGLPRFQAICEGDDKKKSYKRLHRWRYSPTACYGNNEVHLHPYLPRRISAAEALAIQSLPKEFELPATMTLSNMFKTIGNGVPFLASYGIAKTIKDYLTEVMNEKNHRQQYCSSH